MARKKITLEEKLEEAVIKVVPYEVPGNWVWTTMKSLCGINMGQSPKGESVNDIGDGYPLIGGPSDMGDLYPLKRRYATNVNKISSSGTIIMSIRATLGKINISDGEYCLGRGVAEIVPKELSRDYLKYYISYINKDLYKVAKGTTFLQISKPDLESIEIPIPPLKEQQRIVAKIESFFENLDKSKELIEEARDDFEKRKSAILEKAFRGEMTREWRSKNRDKFIINEDFNELKGEYFTFDIPGDIPNEWIWVRFNQCCTKLGSGSTPKGGREIYGDSGIPFIRSQNVLKGKMELDDIAYISEDIHEKMNKTKVISGDTLLNITGASIGRASLLDKGIKEANVNQHVCIFRFKDYVLDKYPQYWFNSPKFQKIIADQQIGATREALNFKQLRGMWIPLPPLEEQKEIVRILDKLLEEESKIEELTQLEEQIELIKKSILAKAFRGQLGTNCEEDESALELLEVILSKK